MAEDLEQRLVGLESELAASKPTLHKAKVTKRLAVTCAIVLTAGAAGIYAVLSASRQPAFFPPSISERALFPLFYPAKLPSSYQVVDGSLQMTDQVVTYTLADTSQNTIFVSIQPRVSSFDYDEFQTEKVGNPRGVLTEYGKAVIGDGETGKLASLVTERSWLLMTTVGASDAQLQSALESIVEIK